MSELSPEILTQLPHWQVVNDKLHRTFEFADFTQAFDFMSRASGVIESMNHHPEWCNTYNKVVVNLTTHSEGCVTQLDTQLAQQMDDIYNLITPMS